MAKDTAASKKYWKLMSFQYKPIEKLLLQDAPHIEPKYLKLSIPQKIYWLDRYAAEVLGL